MKFVQFLILVGLLEFVIARSVDVLVKRESYYKPLTDDEAERLAAWTPENEQNMWELSGQYQGDMVLTGSNRNGVKDENKRWPNNEIPYELSDDFGEEEKKLITEALEGEYNKTCIKPRRRTNDDIDYVYVTGNKSGCWSEVGRTGGPQKLNLQKSGCLYRGTIVHEFLHALGFQHQQSAPDRDDYVNIFWDNIQKGKESNFAKYGEDEVTSFGEKYDYSSVMHYGKTAFSKNDKQTILPKDRNVDIGKANGLSNIDIIKLNKMYGCV